MNTALIQSYRTTDVPSWIRRCMDSVRAWAEGEGWDYRFEDDRFLRRAPDWVRERCAGNIYAVTDVCRLRWARGLLDEGYERVIWADADILVFEPKRLDVSTRSGSAFAHELFLKALPDGKIDPVEGINNALMVFERGSDIPERYLSRCLQRLEGLSDGAVPRTALLPAVFRELGESVELEPLPGVGLFTLGVMQDIARGGGPMTALLQRLSPAPLGAANLCHFLRDGCPPVQRPGFDALYDRALDRLLCSGSDPIFPSAG